MVNNKYVIKGCKGHYEIYIDGKFYCSADTFNEATEELKKAEKGNNDEG